MNNQKVLVFGDVNMDIIVNNLAQMPRMGQEIFVDSLGVCVGGSAANTAVRLAMLGIEIDLFSCIGDDVFGNYITEYFETIGVNTSLCYRDTHCPSGVSIGISDQSDRFFVSHMGTNGVYDPSKFIMDALSQYSHVHFSLYSLDRLVDKYLDIAKRAKAVGCTTSLDMGWTELGDNKENLFALLDCIDVFFPNDHEAKYLCQTDDLFLAIDILSQHVKKIVVVTMGSEGAYVYDGKNCYQCRYEVEAVDAVGAGDAFDAGFIKAFVERKATSTCLEYGCACGALVVSTLGGSSCVLSMPKVLDFISAQTQSVTKISY